MKVKIKATSEYDVTCRNEASPKKWVSHRETRTRIWFSGSERAFEIWKRGHYLPIGAKIERRVKL
jgi:hypothetical protein